MWNLKIEKLREKRGIHEAVIRQATTFAKGKGV